MFQIWLAICQLFDGSIPFSFLTVSPFCLFSSTHEQSGPGLRQPDTRPKSLKHHLSLNYSLCHWASPVPLHSLIRELMGHSSCWPGVRSVTPCPCSPRGNENLFFGWSHGWPDKWMDRRLPVGKGSGLVGVCMHVNVCFEAERSAFVICPRCPRVWLVWPVRLSKCSLCPLRHHCSFAWYPH